MIITLIAVICNAQFVCVDYPIGNSKEFPMTMEECRAETAGGYGARITVALDPHLVGWTFKTWRCERSQS
jgi:hypothetical protein